MPAAFCEEDLGNATGRTPSMANKSASQFRTGTHRRASARGLLKLMSELILLREKAAQAELQARSRQAPLNDDPLDKADGRKTQPGVKRRKHQVSAQRIHHA